MEPSSYITLESLAGDLLLGSSNRGGGVGVVESAALLAVLELSANARADTNSLPVIGTAGLCASC